MDLSIFYLLPVLPDLNIIWVQSLVPHLLNTSIASSVSRATRHATTKNVLLNPTGILQQQHLEETDYLARTEAVSSMLLEQLHAATVIHDDYNTITSRSPSPAINVDDILSGNSQIDLSHEGGGFSELLAMDEDVLSPPAW